MNKRGIVTVFNVLILGGAQSGKSKYALKLSEEYIKERIRAMLEDCMWPPLSLWIRRWRKRFKDTDVQQDALSVLTILN
jgi:hypothetical protein